MGVGSGSSIKNVEMGQNDVIWGGGWKMAAKGKGVEKKRSSAAKRAWRSSRMLVRVAGLV